MERAGQYPARSAFAEPRMWQRVLSSNRRAMWLTDEHQHGRSNMKIQSLVLCGVASIALIGAFATPSFAQYSGNPPQVSTPAEQQQTQQLNQQAQDGTTTAPAALNGQAPAGTPSATQVQYNDQQQQYQDQKQQYQNEQERYRNQRAQYLHDLHRYDVAQYQWRDYPTRVYAYRFRDDSALVHVNTLDRRQLSYTPVEGPDGRWVGRIRSFETTPDGHVGGRMEIALNRHVSVWVNTNDLVYDPQNRVIFTDLTRDALWAMPGETIETTDYYRP
jgi:hypothetical protein